MAAVETGVEVLDAFAQKMYERPKDATTAAIRALSPSTVIPLVGLFILGTEAPDATCCTSPPMT